MISLCICVRSCGIVDSGYWCKKWGESGEKSDDGGNLIERKEKVIKCVKYF